MSSINVKFLSADQRIKYEIESFPDAKFNEFITELYDIYPEYYETINLFMHKGSSIYDDCPKKLSELKITNNAVLILTQTDKRRKDENIEKMRKEMFERQRKIRQQKQEENISSLTEEQKTNLKINNILEDMCIYGNIIKKEIQFEKKNHPDKYIETDDALQMEKIDQGVFVLGLLAKTLENKGIETAIEKKENKDDIMDDADATCLQFICNGMIDKTKYNLRFDFGEEKNKKILKDEKEFEKFKEKLKLKLSKDYNTPSDKIVVTFPQRGSVSVDVIFQSDEFNNLDKNEFLKKFKNDNQFRELRNLKDIQIDLLMSACKLTKNQLDPRGNRSEGWAINEKRGGKEYDPPLGWIGIGLKVWDKYENNIWIGMENALGEWCVAYHGVGSGQSSDDVKKVVGLIYKGSFKKGERQAHKDCKDQYHPGKKVGEGVYCTPSIKTAECYAGYSEINNISYKTVLMVRVKPEVIRHCDSCDDSKAPYNYWVVNGTTDEIRPYRILYKIG